MDQCGALELADAVLSADAAAHCNDDVMNNPIQFFLARHEGRAVTAIRLAEVEMDVAVTDMTKCADSQARDAVLRLAAGLVHKFGHPGDRHRNVVLDRGAGMLLSLGNSLAQLPEIRGLGTALCDYSVADQPVLHGRGEEKFGQCAQIVAG